MTREEKKEYLRQYKIMAEEISLIRDEIKIMQEQHRHEEVEKLKTEIEQKEIECAGMCAQIIRQIESMDDRFVIQKRLLLERYVNCKTWSQIEHELHYERAHIHRIHGKALDNFKS